MSLPVDKATRMEEGSSGVGKMGNTEQFFKDKNMPDGDACRPDGTLKDASELSFPNSPSDATMNLPEIGDEDAGYFFKNLKRAHRNDDSDEESSSESTSDEHPKTKVSYISIAFTCLENLPML